ncbi:MAG: tripartite tricarboxylate transporter substrate binding protein [Proteobacteria bacterium]|nr:tripartite tricarboxylate transporter substrate binding protein [Pseudomonadota bacterium]
MVRKPVLLLASIAVLAGASAVRAQDNYPTKAIRLVVPFAAAGPTDIVARLVGGKMTDSLGQQIVVDNRGGAGGNLGSDLVAKAAPDGYTLLMGTVATHALNAALYPKMPYDPIADFEPITMLVTVPALLEVHPSVPAQDLKSFIALLKANPGKYSYASSGNGTPLHLSGELFKSMAGVQMEHVPYRGTGPALIDVLAGQVPVMFDIVSTSIGHIKEGKLRGLAVTSLKRIEALPNVPTMNEAGLPGYETYTWNALFAPARTPAPIIAKLNAAANKAIADAAVRAKLIELNYQVVGTTPAQLAAHVKAEIAKWTPVVKQSGAKID